MPKSDFFIPYENFSRAVEYIQFVEKFQKFLMYLFENFSKHKFISQMVEVALEQNHKLFMSKEKSVIDHLRYFQTVLKVLGEYHKRNQQESLKRQVAIGYAILTNGCKGQGIANLKELNELKSENPT